MNTLVLGTPYHPGWAFVDWLLDLLNVFNEDRGDDHTPTDDDDDTGTDDDDDSSADGDDDPSGDDGDDDDNDDDDDGDDAPAAHMIPKHRYDSASKRAQDAEAENNTLREQLAARETADDTTQITYEQSLQDLDRKIEEARADNNIDEVVRLGAEKRAVEQEALETFTTETAQETTTAAQHQRDFDSVVTSLEKANPILNPDHKDFDENMVSDIVDLQVGWVGSGKYTPAEAMQKAAAHFLTPNDPANIDSKKTDVAKNLAAAKGIPPDTGDKGANSDKGGDPVQDAAQIGEMTMAEFDALPESTKIRLRGDAG